MLISAAPVAIPVTTAHPPTEAVATEAAQKSPIPKPASSSDAPNSRNSTEANEQPKNQAAAGTQVTEKEPSKDDSQEQSQQQERKEQQKTLEQRQQIEQLRKTDREVRAHETAHASAGGQLAGAPQLHFTQGPDGKRYAVSGEVSIDTSRVSNNPQATIEKMLQVQRAALAPTNPSNQDFKVAAIASQIANQARIELNLQLDEAAIQRKPANEDGATSTSQAEPSRRGASIYFSNPVSARRASLVLNQKLANSGAFEDAEKEQAISLRA